MIMTTMITLTVTTAISNATVQDIINPGSVLAFYMIAATANDTQIVSSSSTVSATSAGSTTGQFKDHMIQFPLARVLQSSVAAAANPASEELPKGAVVQQIKKEQESTKESN